MNGTPTTLMKMILLMILRNAAARVTSCALSKAIYDVSLASSFQLNAIRVDKFHQRSIRSASPRPD